MPPLEALLVEQQADALGALVEDDAPVAQAQELPGREPLLLGEVVEQVCLQHLAPPARAHPEQGRDDHHLEALLQQLHRGLARLQISPSPLPLLFASSRAACRARGRGSAACLRGTASRFPWPRPLRGRDPMGGRARTASRTPVHRRVLQAHLTAVSRAPGRRATRITGVRAPSSPSTTL